MQVAVLLAAPVTRVTVLVQVMGVTPSAKLTVPPVGTASPLTPVMVATKVSGVPKVEVLELPA